jgi:homoserine acetyltransferase
VTGYQVFHHQEPFSFQYNEGVLPEIQVAYETYGQLNAERSNAILIFTGLSASSHARSHDKNPQPGWWEQFVGPELAVNTSKYFVVCANHIGGCYGSTGDKN